jgi:thiol-disulfide isomerase/thioredoxin
LIGTKSLARPVVFVPLFVLLLALIGFLGSSLSRHHYSYSKATETGSVQAYFPIDQKLPRITDKGIGPETSIAEMLGSRPGGLIVNFWATWCPPCVEELPSLELLQRQLEARHNPALPTVLAISVDQKPQDVLDFYRTLDFKPSLPQLFDKEGTLARSVGTVQFPETYWIAKNGAVVYKWVGPENWVSVDVIDRLAHTDPALRR